MLQRFIYKYNGAYLEWMVCNIKWHSILHNTSVVMFIKMYQLFLILIHISWFVDRLPNSHLVWFTMRDERKQTHTHTHTFLILYLCWYISLHNCDYMTSQTHAHDRLYFIRCTSDGIGADDTQSKAITLYRTSNVSNSSLSWLRYISTLTTCSINVPLTRFVKMWASLKLFFVHSR